MTSKKDELQPPATRTYSRIVSSSTIGESLRTRCHTDRSRLVKDTHAYGRFHSSYVERRALVDKFNPGIIDRIEYITGETIIEASTVEDTSFAYDLRSEHCTPKPQEWPVIRCNVRLLGQWIPGNYLLLRDTPYRVSEFDKVITENPEFRQPTHAFNGRINGHSIVEWRYVDLGVFVILVRIYLHLWGAETTGFIHIDDMPFRWFDLDKLEQYPEGDGLIVASSVIQKELFPLP